MERTEVILRLTEAILGSSNPRYSHKLEWEIVEIAKTMADQILAPPKLQVDIEPTAQLPEHTQATIENIAKAINAMQESGLFEPQKSWQQWSKNFPVAGSIYSPSRDEAWKDLQQKLSLFREIIESFQQDEES